MLNLCIRVKYQHNMGRVICQFAHHHYHINTTFAHSLSVEPLINHFIYSTTPVLSSLLQMHISTAGWQPHSLLRLIHTQCLICTFGFCCAFLLVFSAILHCVSKKRPTLSFAVTLTNTDRFSKFFHWYIVWKICNNAIIKYATTP